MLLVAVSGLAGCIEAPDDGGCRAADCPDERRVDVPVPLPPRGTLDLPDALYPRFQTRGCEEFVQFIEVPHENLRPLIPEEFRLASLAPGIMANILIHVLRCEESLDNESLFGPVHFLYALATVELTNASWADGVYLNRYVIHAASDNKAWNEAMLETGLSFDYAKFTFTRSELPTGSFVALLQAEASDWDLAVEFSFLTGDWQTSVSEFRWWYGAGPYHRMTYSSAFEVQATPAVGMLAHMGESPLAQVMPSPIMVHVQGAWQVRVHALFQYDGAWTI